MRQHDVEHDEIGILLAEPLESLLAVAGRDDAESLAFERIRQELLNGFLVVDEQDGRWVGHTHACRATGQLADLL